eukprot:634102-Hanusia_phi.AAC.1
MLGSSGASTRSSGWFFLLQLPEACDNLIQGLHRLSESVIFLSRTCEVNNEVVDLISPTSAPKPTRARAHLSDPRRTPGSRARKEGWIGLLIVLLSFPLVPRAR